MDGAQFDKLSAKAADIAEDAFIEMRNDFTHRHDAEYQKRRYALSLRLEAAGKIGIENIRNSRIKKLEDELSAVKDEYEEKRVIRPSFRPMLICCVR